MKFRVGDLIIYSRGQDWTRNELVWEKRRRFHNRGVVIGYVLRSPGEGEGWGMVENDINQKTFDNLRLEANAGYKIQWVDNSCPWAIRRRSSCYYESELDLLCR